MSPKKRLKIMQTPLWQALNGKPTHAEIIRLETVIRLEEIYEKAWRSQEEMGKQKLKLPPQK